MSIFPSRCASPPPRSPSPEIVLAPLPPPRRRNPNRPPRLSLQSSDERPNLKAESKRRSLASMRSCGDLRYPATPKSASRSAVSAPATPRTLVPSSPSGSSFRRTHKRTLSFAVPYRSPPPSPTLSSPPPPVPPIPEFVLSPTDKKPVLHPVAPTRVNHIYLPEWEQFTVVPDVVSPRKKRASMSPSGRRTTGVAAAAPPPPGMTCSTFFALHNETQRPNRVVAL
ncbi:hypothetical protein MSAN_01460600 [Mycena sanguinolenta]|uniref:Uncharacterized protein n=1 Tax=Mycena sanguinolenta TaxID=230812 RepID=A0A8H7D1M8_9AGAR|nr:hypothetical protein MSAN_01460600 [Mycena sanguinolenta]